MTELALLADEVGVSDRTLRRAVHQGTLRGTWPTPRKLTLSLPERRFIRRSWGLLSALRTGLRTEPNVRLAVLFGSTAEGTDASESDIDLLVDLREHSLERVLDLSEKLGLIVRRPVDLVRLQEAEGDPCFLSEVLAEGRVLVDRDKVWTSLQRREPSLRRHRRRNESERAGTALAGIDRLLAAG